MNHTRIAAALLAATLAGAPFFLNQAAAGDNTKASQQGTAPTGLKIGDAAPDAELIDALTNAKVQTASLWKDRPVVISFYRGGWCPYCTKSLSAWQGRAAELEAAGATLVAVAMEKPSLITKTREKHKLDLLLLADATGTACRAFKTLFDLDEKTREKYQGYGIDLSKNNENGQWQLPVPATYVIDTKGTVRYVHFDPDYSKRASPDDVIAAVKALR
ncbi:MAG: peroxiredoxin-like family protein [Phycisphaerales bacterium]